MLHRPRGLHRGWVAWMVYCWLWRRGTQFSLGYTACPRKVTSSTSNYFRTVCDGGRGLRRRPQPTSPRPLIILREPFPSCNHGVRRSWLSITVGGSDLSNGDASEGLASASSSLNAAAERAFRTLSRRRRGNDSWLRFQPLVDMAIQAALSSSPLLRHATNEHTTASNRGPPTRTRTSMVDVGCDHGLLSACLAVTGCFERVLGVDLSLSALESGAFALRDDMEEYRANRIQTKQMNDSPPPALRLEYRVGNGLQGLQDGEADVICLAGMGVRTMIEILTERVAFPKLSTATRDDDNTTARYRLDEINCQTVLVQPTNARPRNLISLYDALASAGFAPVDERIAWVGSRWFFSAAFSKQTSAPLGPAMPGSLLVDSVEALDRPQLLAYLSHYCQWLYNDARMGPLQGGEDEWLSRFDKARLQLERKYN